MWTWHFEMMQATLGPQWIHKEGSGESQENYSGYSTESWQGVAFEWRRKGQRKALAKIWELIDRCSRVGANNSLMWLDLLRCVWGDEDQVWNLTQTLKGADSRRYWMPDDVGYLPWSGDRGELGFWLSWVLVLMPEMSTHLLWCLTQHQVQSPVKDRRSSIFHVTPTLTTLRMSSVTAAYLLPWKDNCGCILYSWKNKLLSLVLISMGVRGIAYSVQYNIKSSF